MKKRRILLATVATSLIAVLSGCNNEDDKKIIDLNDYLECGVSGYEGKGGFDWEFNIDEAYQDIIQGMTFNSGRDEELFYEDVDDAIFGRPNKGAGLSNGNTIIFEWRVDKELIKEIEERSNCKIVYENKEIKVEGLKAMVDYNPFDDIKVSFEGINGEGEIDVDISENIPVQFWFSIDKGEGLSNGDKVTVKITRKYENGSIKDYCEEQGIKILQTEQEYVVEGLYDYVTKIDQVTEETKEQLDAQAKQLIKEYVASSWDNPETFKEATLAGEAFVHYETWTVDTDAYVLIHKIDVNNGGDEFSYYYHTFFNNILVAPDGTNEFNENDYRAASRMYPEFVRNNLIYKGQLTIEEIFENMGTGFSDFHIYEQKKYE